MQRLVNTHKTVCMALYIVFMTLVIDFYYDLFVSL